MAREMGRGRGAGGGARAGRSTGSQSVKTFFLHRKQKIRIYPVRSRLLRGYSKIVSVHSWQIDSSGKAHQTYYGKWETWGTVFSSMLRKTSVPSQGWMVTQVTLREKHRPPASRGLSLGEQDAEGSKEAFEMVVSGTSMGKERRGWGAAEPCKRQSEALIQGRHEKGTRKKNGRSGHLLNNYYVPSTLRTYLCLGAILQTDNVTLVLQRGNLRLTLPRWQAADCEFHRHRFWFQRVDF